MVDLHEELHISGVEQGIEHELQGAIPVEIYATQLGTTKGISGKV